MFVKEFCSTVHDFFLLFILLVKEKYNFEMSVFLLNVNKTKVFSFKAKNATCAIYPFTWQLIRLTSYVCEENIYLWNKRKMGNNIFFLNCVKGFLITLGSNTPIFVTESMTPSKLVYFRRFYQKYLCIVETIHHKKKENLESV